MTIDIAFKLLEILVIKKSNKRKGVPLHGGNSWKETAGVEVTVAFVLLVKLLLFLYLL